MATPSVDELQQQLAAKDDIIGTCYGKIAALEMKVEELKEKHAAERRQLCTKLYEKDEALSRLQQYARAAAAQLEKALQP